MEDNFTAVDLEEFLVINNEHAIAHENLDNGNTHLVLQKDYSSSDVWYIENLVKEIANTEELGFKIEKGKAATITSRSKVSRHYQIINALVDSYCSDKIYNPYIELFFDTASEVRDRLGRLPKNPEDVAIGSIIGAEMFNEIVSVIRTNCGSNSFKKKVGIQKQNLARNFKSACSYVNALFDRFARLLVIRLDLYFNDQKQGEQTSLADAQSHFNHFLNNRRNNSSFSSVVGYIWKLEYGEHRGHHFHVMLFLDGSKAHKDAFIGNEIGNYWKKVTDEKGHFYNANMNKAGYKSVGIGMINHNEIEKRNTLLEVVVRYFFKQDQYLKMKYSKKLRTYGRGEISAKRTSSLGRPRQL
jgi:hypothetical protein